MQVCRGVPVSPGIAIGKVRVLHDEEGIISERFIKLQADIESNFDSYSSEEIGTFFESEFKRHIERFHEAVEDTKKELEKLQTTTKHEMDTSETINIFSSHIHVLSDPIFVKKVCDRISKNRFTAEYAVRQTLAEFSKMMRRIQDRYMSERADDFADINKRLQRAFLQIQDEEIKLIKEPIIFIAHDLNPTQTASFELDKFLGLVTEIGGETSHTAIIARARKIPAVVGVPNLLSEVSTDDTIIIDGTNGWIITQPDEKTLLEYQKRRDDYNEYRKLAISGSNLEAITQDGVKVTIEANIEFPSELSSVISEYGGDGIGLYRTEFLYIVQPKGSIPTEEDHFNAYCDVIRSMSGRSVTIRTLDFGADKCFHANLHKQAKNAEPILSEANPALGCRAIRYCNRHTEILKMQLRAICRATVETFSPVKVMIPMVTTREEVIKVRSMLHAVIRELADRNIIVVPSNIKIGIMVETPAVAIALSMFTDICDFFSIGTNDLTQYTLAVDRGNQYVEYLYRVSHPAVVRLIRDIIEVSNQTEIPVSMCGEMASIPRYIILLLGLGLRNFSVAPAFIPEVKKIVRSVSIHFVNQIAKQALSFRSHDEVDGYLRNMLQQISTQYDDDTNVKL